MTDEIELFARMGAPIRTRTRRGKTVIIPDEWVGHVTSQQTIRKRQSKHPRKLRTIRSWSSGKYPRPRRDNRAEYEQRLSWKRKSGGHPKHWAPRLSPHKLRYDLEEGWE